MRIKGFRIGFYSADFDEPPHVHVDKGGNQTKFWLEPLQHAKNAGFARSELGEIYDLLREHRQELLTKWNEYFG
ncbi:MAG TPA: DUF4160 domain-containing protein [Verrucomicrobiae bacterium]